MQCDFNTLISQPHSLIAGATGSGKSNLLHNIIDTILNYPQCILCLIDPKRVELSLYKNYGNAQIYACDNDDIITALDAILETMTDRYNIMEENTLREYNGAHCFLIIDELADLMTTSKKAVLPRLQRILQLGRAARIHVIAATQAPDRTYTLPAPLKLNFTDRIALRCATSIESKQIIDAKGAENLPQYGKAIYRDCIGNLNVVDIPYIPTEKILARVQEARQKYKFLYLPMLMQDKPLYKRLYPEDFNCLGLLKRKAV